MQIMIVYPRLMLSKKFYKKEFNHIYEGESLKMLFNTAEVYEKLCSEKHSF